MNRRGIRRQFAAVVLAIAATVLFVPLTAASAANSATEAYVRGAHFSPDTPAVDVYLSAFSGGTSTLWLSSVSYGDVSGYRPITPGVYAVSMRPHGAAASTPPALTWTVNIAAGSAYTAAAIGTNSQLRGIVLPDSLTPPAADTGKVRVIQASSQAGHVSVKVQNGPTLTDDIAYGAASDYVTVPTGQWTLLTQSSSQPTLSSQSTVSVASGTLSSIVILDQAGGGLATRAVVDASGSGTVPSGSVPAGGGGTAARPGGSIFGPLSWAAFGSALALAALAGIRYRRSHERRA